MQSLVREVAKAMEMELNFRHWVKQSRKAAKVYAEAEGLTKTPKSIAERLLEDGNINTGTLTKWRRVFNELNTYKWDDLAEYYCGDALVSAVVGGLPEQFEFCFVSIDGKRPKYVRMTDKYREELDRVEAQIVRMQAVKKPMLTKPKDWVITEHEGEQ